MLKQIAGITFLIAFGVVTYGSSQGYISTSGLVAAVGISNPVVSVTTSVNQIASGGNFSVSVSSPATTQISKLQVVCPALVTVMSGGQNQCGKVQVLNSASSVTNYTVTNTASSIGSVTFSAEVFSLSGQSVQRNVASAYILVNPAPVVANSVSAVLVPNIEDKVGVWSVFGPGRANTGSRLATDWKWEINFSSGVQKTISSIKITHAKEGGTWSTAENSYYPLVILNSTGQQLNTAYVGSLAATTTKLYAFGQKEQLRYGGGTITVTFSDGSTPLTATIPTPSVSSVKITHTTEGGVWSTSESAYYPLVVFNAADQKLNTAYSNNLLTLPANAPATSVSATVVPNVLDRAGVWGTFGQGQANTGARPTTDWKWAVNFVLENGVTVPFTLYGQMERTIYSGGAITVTFSDGSVLTASIPAYTPPTITVQSPNGGGNIAPGSSQEIRWTTNSTSTIPNVGIALFGTSGVTPIRVSLTPGGTPNDGVHTVTIPANTLPGTYKIEVSGTASGGASVVDTSDAVFTVGIVTPVTPPVVLSPNGGETIYFDTEFTISVTSALNDRYIFYLIDESRGFSSWIASEIRSQGTVTNVPLNIPSNFATPGSSYKIKVCKSNSPNSSVCDTSNSTFRLVAPAVPASLGISVAPSTTTRNAVAGSTGFEFTRYLFDASQSGQDIQVFSIPLLLAVSGVSATSLTNCQLFDGVTALTTGPRLVNPTAAGDINFTLDGTGLIVPKGTIKTLALKCNLASSVPSGTISWGLTNNQATYIFATDAVNGLVVPETMTASAGPTVVVTTPGSYRVSIDDLPYRVEKAGRVDVPLAKFRFTASAQEGILLRKVALKLGNPGSNSPGDLVGQKVSLWDGTVKIGEAQFGAANPDVAVSTLATPVSIQAGTTKIIVVKGDLINHDSNTNSNSTPNDGGYGSFLSITYDSAPVGTNGNYAVGQTSGVNINPLNNGDVPTNGVRIFRNIPTFARVPSAGVLGVNTDLYKFTVTNPDGARDLVLKRATFSVATTGAAVKNFVLYADGAIANLPTNARGVGGSQLVVIDFAPTSVAKIIPAGTTRTFMLRASTVTSLATVPTMDSIVISLLADRAYPILPKLMGNVSQISSGIVGTGSTANANITWSPFSTTTPVASAASENNQDWTNGYGLPGFPALGQDFPSQASTRIAEPISQANLAISVVQSYSARTAISGSTGFEFARYIFDASQSGQDIRVNSIPLLLAVSGSGISATSLTNCQLFDGTIAVTTGPRLVNPTAVGDRNFTFDGTGIVIPKGTAKTISLKCNLAASVAGTILWGLTNNQATYIFATDAVNGLVVPETMTASAGQAVIVSAHGSYTVGADALNYRVEKAGGVNIVLGAIRFNAGHEEPVLLKQVALKLGNPGSNSPGDLVGQKVSLWYNNTKVGEAQFGGANPDVAVSTLITPVLIPAGTGETIFIKGDLVHHDSNTNSDSTPNNGGYGALLSITYNGGNNGLTGNYGTGQTSGFNISPSTTVDIPTNGVRIFRNVPTFATVLPSSTGLATGESQVYTFKVTNPDSSRGLALKKLVFSVATSSNTQAFYRLFGDGFPANATGVKSTGATGSQIVTIVFDPASNAKIISAGSSKTFVLKTVVTAGASGTNRVSTVALLADRAYPSFAKLMGNAQQAGAGPVGIGAMASGNIVWSPFSTTTFIADAASENNQDWTNGYGLPGFPALGQNLSSQTYFSAN